MIKKYILTLSAVIRIPAFSTEPVLLPLPEVDAPVPTTRTSAVSPEVKNATILKTTEYMSEGRKITIHTIKKPTIDPVKKKADTSLPQVLQKTEASATRSFLALHAVVIDHKTTLLKWKHGGEVYEAWSNLDFNYFTGFPECVRGSHRYTTLLSITPLSSSDLSSHPGIGIPPALPQTPATYSVTKGDPTNRTALQNIEALHEFYKNEKPTLQAALDARKSSKLVTIDPRFPNTKEQKENVVLYHWSSDDENSSELPTEGSATK